MKTFYDCEFLERGYGYPIDPISIGAVREDNETFYRIVNNIDTLREAAKNPWMVDNVLRYLPVKKGRYTSLVWDTSHPDYQFVSTRETIAAQWQTFVLDAPKLAEFDKPELWAWYGAYDHVVVSQLFGRMIDLPRGMPMYTQDIKQRWHNEGKPEMPKQASDAHKAIGDALWNKIAYEHLDELQEA